MTPEQKKLIRHALGLDAAQMSYRNRFYTPMHSPDHDIWLDMCAAGYAGRRGEIATGANTMFFVTLKGALAVLLPGESLCPEDFPTCWTRLKKLLRRLTRT